jgi:hypothetical protein
LWAFEFEAGKFIAGEILGDTLYMYAPTGRGEKWVMNSEGVVLEYSSEPFYKSDEIIAGINAHYGTSFSQEDDIDKDFTIGETMPNWNAYEKIGFIKWAYEFTPNMFVAGEIQKDILYIYTPLNKTDKWMFDNIGKVSTYAPFGEPYLQNTINAVNVHFGTSFVEINDLEINLTYGETLPSWEAYEKIT